ncbi:hypothetical protein BASA50_003662 [Batrachochytrium salamandrivorans]|uniref:Non-structural maintenance of chromosomes element 1 homolog n=1 Tax=Batrachochytrium salamandrivorans TaxID=1357716 RepID=A0ABQ8FI36_9FUNG|nr:hypothetical protein BASA62_007230 [Batrachochytrium salamandrivorans]KAH6579234.1 hypothetical protein BASA60_003352 [Batrachochytrium salamandrivorans]KAH6598626.1 hypothetical protein BASA50_003662 [Batrachochytrium salamandrivorans]KAH6600802.1 hypothetical protein BASA61_002220 [Batrachochytrium salamandrivorans]KAH9256710.1 hypothetical protein BASA81_005215 [Batrachochytrium salamandrivorans]
MAASDQASSSIAAVDAADNNTHISYGNVHRMFLQGLMARQVMSLTDASVLYTRIAEQEQVDQISLDSFIIQINTELNRNVGLEIKRGINPESGDETLVLINVQADELSQLAAAYTPSEVLFFKSMIEMLMTERTDGCFELSSIKALRIASHLKPALTKECAEMFISRLVDDSWLLDRRGKLTLGVRSLLELRPYLMEEYPDNARECSSCFQILTINTTLCTNDNCDAALHASCVEKVFGTQSIRTCFKCSTPWPDKPNQNTQRRPTGRTGLESNTRPNPDPSMASDSESDHDQPSESPPQKQRSMNVKQEKMDRRPLARSNHRDMDLDDRYANEIKREIEDEAPQQQRQSARIRRH